MKPHIILGTLSLTEAGCLRQHEVAHAPGYGYVCNSLFTSNGTLGEVERQLEGYLSSWRYTSGHPKWNVDLEIGRQKVAAGSVRETLMSEASKQGVARQAA